MKKLLYLIIPLCLVLLVHCATEQKTTLPTAISEEKCDAPIWNVGDSWRYQLDDKKEGEIKVLGVEDFKNTKIYVVEDVYGFSKTGVDIKTLQHIVDIAPDGRKIVPMTDWALSYDFPFYVGKKWSKSVSGKDAGGSRRDYLYTYKVVSFENITVPAGEFRAFKIEFIQLDYMMSGELRVYIWYSPEVKREVKFQFGPVYGGWRITGQGYELKSFKLVNKQPTTPEIKSSTDKVEPATKPQVSPHAKPRISIPVTPP